jgi:hypothetical protein
MLDKVIMQRLALIRYLYALALDQSKQPEPLNMIALLHFHDAVELFLALASEYLNAGKTGQGFMDYWEAINQKLPGKDFAQKDAMKRLNAARANFKHHGIVIAPAEIEAFRLNVEAFFRENAQKVFALDFDDVSMSALVLEDAVRTRLEEADTLRSRGDIAAALKEVACAFQELLHGFKWRLFKEQQTFPFESLPPAGLLPSASSGSSEFARSVAKALRDLNEQVKILSLGIDYRSYVRFQWLTPPVFLMMSGRYETSGDGHGHSSQDYTFCSHFVIECALRLQEFSLCFS